MTLRELILKEHSKAQCNRIVSRIGNDQKKFDELVHLFLNDEYRVVQRAGWPLSELAIKYPKLATKHLSPLLKNLKNKGLHEAVKRNTVRLLEAIDIPEKYHGEVMNYCFDFIMDPAEKAAVKAYSLGILQKLILIYPDIRQELIMIIEERWAIEGAAFRSRAKRIVNSQ